MEVTSAAWQSVILTILYTSNIHGQNQVSSADNLLGLPYGQAERAERSVVGSSGGIVAGIPQNGVVLPNLSPSGFVNQPYNSISLPSLSQAYSFGQYGPRFPFVKSIVSAVKHITLFLLGMLQLTDVDRYSSLHQAGDSVNSALDSIVHYVRKIKQVVHILYVSLAQVPILGLFVRLTVSMLHFLAYFPMAIISAVAAFVRRLVDAVDRRQSGYVVPGVPSYYA